MALVLWFLFSAFRSTLLGKVLRIDVDGRNPNGKPYCIPLIIHSCLIPKPAERFMPMESGIWCCAVDRGDPITKKGRGRIFWGMSGRTGLRKSTSTSFLKEGTMAGEQRRGLNAMTQSFATTPPWVRRLPPWVIFFLVEDYYMCTFNGL